VIDAVAKVRKEMEIATTTATQTMEDKKKKAADQEMEKKKKAKREGQAKLDAEEAKIDKKAPDVADQLAAARQRFSDETTAKWDEAEADRKQVEEESTLKGDNDADAASRKFAQDVEKILADDQAKKVKLKGIDETEEDEKRKIREEAVAKLDKATEKAAAARKVLEPLRKSYIPPGYMLVPEPAAAATNPPALLASQVPEKPPSGDTGSPLLR